MAKYRTKSKKYTRGDLEAMDYVVSLWDGQSLMDIARATKKSYQAIRQAVQLLQRRLPMFKYDARTKTFRIPRTK